MDYIELCIVALCCIPYGCGRVWCGGARYIGVWRGGGAGRPRVMQSALTPNLELVVARIYSSALSELSHFLQR